MLVVGLGSGRSGTSSLAHLLNLQKNSNVSHEYFGPALSWTSDYEKCLSLMRLFDKYPSLISGDVAFYYLNYVELIWSAFPETQFICLQRNREQTIQSFMSFTEGTNHWLEHDGQSWRFDAWDKCFPKYTVMPKERAIGLYYDTYYEKALAYQTANSSQFHVFDIMVLNSEEGQRKILDVPAIPRDHQILDVGCQVNTKSNKQKQPFSFLRFLRKRLKHQ